MSGVKDGGDDGRPDHTMALLGYVLDGLRLDVTSRTASASRRVPVELRSLRTSQIRLLSLCPAAGLRVTDLAVRVGMTKQALGEFASALEDLGLLETVRDPQDRRVRILRPTRRGRRVVAASEMIIAEVEAEWRDRFGPERWQVLRSLLRDAAEWPDDNA